MKTLRHRGLFFAASSAVFYGLQPTLIRVAYDGGSNGVTMTFLRSLLAVPVLCLLLRQQGESFKVEKGDLRRILILGVVGSSSTTILLYSSYAYIPTGVATTLHFIYPLLVTVFCILFFREKLTVPKGLAAGLTVLGILCFMGKDRSFHSVGIALALLSGLCYTFFTVYMSTSGLKRYHHFKLALYLCVVVGTCSGLYGMATHQLTFSLTPKAWLFSFLVSLCVSVAGSSLYQLGIRYAGPSTTAILSTLEPITSVILGCLVLKEAMTWVKILGCLCILTGIFLTSFSGCKETGAGLVQETTANCETDIHH